MNVAGLPTSPEACQWLYADDHLLALNKPSGVLSVPGKGEDKQDCAWHWARKTYPDALVVHRLDMATSGVLLFARTLECQRALGQAFSERQVHKRYVALVSPALPTRIGEWHDIDLPIGFDWAQRPLRKIDLETGKPSHTRYCALPQLPCSHASRVALEPLTGRTHQLRVHLAAIGHPILGDTLYAPPAVQAMAPRLQLHAESLQLLHPVTGLPLTLHCEADF
ncbi:pseudouridine synthase [Curvibacter sp. APW13]|uniref:RluA family pseudouridine synthase n=1 Tax=Curvibacter sp. APW13 TaxID=3077236 RepID=UPI0028E04303|nr:pseudouridine synthase [Curvibacter sp. APW13]MDT8989516.1 pseudouridine synthase [Curvibacter sp. APW13]